MKQAGRILLLFVALCALLAVGAFASAEPEETVPAAEERIPITIQVNGEDYQTVGVPAAAEGNVYTFQLAELLDALGLRLAYDKDTAVFTVSAVPGGLVSRGAEAAGSAASSGDDARGPVVLRESDIVTRKLAERSAAHSGGSVPAARGPVVLRESDLVVQKLAERKTAPASDRRVVLRESDFVARKLAERGVVPV